MLTQLLQLLNLLIGAYLTYIFIWFIFGFNWSISSSTLSICSFIPIYYSLFFFFSGRGGRRIRTPFILLSIPQLGLQGGWAYIIFTIYYSVFTILFIFYYIQSIFSPYWSILQYITYLSPCLIHFLPILLILKNYIRRR